MTIAQTLSWEWGHQWQSQGGSGRMAEVSSTWGCHPALSGTERDNPSDVCSRFSEVKSCWALLAGQPHSSTQTQAYLPLPPGSPEVSVRSLKVSACLAALGRAGGLRKSTVGPRWALKSMLHYPVGQRQIRIPCLATPPPPLGEHLSQ